MDGFALLPFGVKQILQNNTDPCISAVQTAQFHGGFFPHASHHASPALFSNVQLPQIHALAGAALSTFSSIFPSKTPWTSAQTEWYPSNLATQKKRGTKMAKTSDAAALPKYLKPFNLTPEVYKYVQDVGVKEDDIVKKLRLRTAEHNKSMMMSAPEEVALFGILLKLMGAKKCIEVGVFTGYTTLAIALALPKDGKIVACDVSEEFTSIGKPFWEEAGVAEKIDLCIAPAMDTLNALVKNGESKTFDFAYVDADKSNYDHYYEALVSKLIRPGGLIAIDNVLWSGKVIQAEKDADTSAIAALNLKLQNDVRVEKVLLPIADGVTLARVL